ncbi:MAG: response regulator [Deltaproteobacteria bacterium]
MAGERVLVIDDDRDYCEEFQEILEAEGFSATCVCSTGEAAQALAQGAFDLVLLDMKMPTMDGVHFLSEHRGRLGAARVIVVSGSVTARRRLEEADVAQFVFAVVPKPFNIAVFLKDIHEALRR